MRGHRVMLDADLAVLYGGILEITDCDFKQLGPPPILLSGQFRGTMIRHCGHTGGNNMSRSAGLKFVGVREFKEKLTGYLGKGEEVVVTRHGKPIARVVPVEKGSPENLLLEIGMVLKEAGVSRDEALRALKAAGKVVYD